MFSMFSVFYFSCDLQGVGRNKSSLITLLSNNRDNGGGDYYTTYWAQPTFLSSRKYYAHFTTTSYSEFNFHFDDFHEVYILSGSPGKIHFFTGPSYLDLVGQFTAFQGRQPPIPEWVYNGVVLGLQGGTERMLHYLKMAQVKSLTIYHICLITCKPLKKHVILLVACRRSLKCLSEINILLVVNE